MTNRYQIYEVDKGYVLMFKNAADTFLIQYPEAKVVAEFSGSLDSSIAMLKFFQSTPISE